MEISFKKLSLLILFLLLSVIALAISAKTDTLYLNDVSSAVDLTGRYCLSPYLSDSNNPTAMNYIYCVDPDHESTLNTNWPVNVTLLDTKTNLSNTSLGNNGLTK